MYSVLQLFLRKQKWNYVNKGPRLPNTRCVRKKKAKNKRLQWQTDVTTKERKGKLSYSSQAHNWVKPTRMIIKKESNVIHFQPPKVCSLILSMQGVLLVLKNMIVSFVQHNHERCIVHI